MNRCLFCYLPIEGGEMDFHPHCSKKMFGQNEPPALPYAEADLEELAKMVVQSQTALTGVQAKISLQISGNEREKGKRRFTIVGLWGGYILKPPSENFPQMPEVEDLTMRLAGLVNIKTAPHSLIRLASGNLAYITKRIDRDKTGKLAMEDLCQLTERITEDKYKGSYEQVAKALLKYSSNPGLDILNYFELLLFCFLTGNADMHLKNFSLLEMHGNGMVLSPAYDLLNTAILNPADKEELALTLNGKKNRIKKQDFQKAMTAVNVDRKQQERIFEKMKQAYSIWINQIENSFLSAEYKAAYQTIIEERLSRID